MTLKPKIFCLTSFCCVFSHHRKFFWGEEAWLDLPVKVTINNYGCEPGHLQSCNHVLTSPFMSRSIITEHFLCNIQMQYHTKDRIAKANTARDIVFFSPLNKKDFWFKRNTGINRSKIDSCICTIFFTHKISTMNFKLHLNDCLPKCPSFTAKQYLRCYIG